MTRFVATVVACLIVCGKLADTAQDGYCFRYRDPRGSRGKCQQLVERLPGPDGAPVATREACCLLGAEGWSKKISGKRCVAACEVPGPVEVQAPQVVQQVAEYEEDQNSVEGVWGRWRDGQPCSVTCGAGFEERRRVCRPSPDNPDDNFQCSGDRVEHRDCNAGIICPVHGQWGEWSLWSECSATCGDTMARFRECDSPRPQFGGNPCVGESREVQWCNDKRHCPIEGVWGRWRDGQPCSVTCGAGFEERRRVCRPSPDNPDDNFQCSGDRVEHRDCNAGIICPVHGQWGEWSLWSECSATCGDTMARFRECDSPSPQFEGNPCVGESREVQWCNDKRHCPMHGQWGEWSLWSECSATCGDTMARFRECDSPRPQFGGNPCVGESREVQWCNDKRHCPMHGQWGEWSLWSECSATCGDTMARFRECDSPRPQFGGNPCVGESREVQWCNDKRHCPMHGQWGEWSLWSECSATCGDTMARFRECDSPRPQFGGNPCVGESREVQWCNDKRHCPMHGQWGEWSLWSECSATCGDTMARFRECDSPRPQFGGNPCVGESREVQWCNDKRHCPIHGGWREWLDWSPCSVTCGRDGERRRIRKCTAPRPRYGGRDCVGDQTDIRSCKANALNCPVDGGVSEWGQWRCQAECTGEGFALRSRSCTNPVPRYGGRQCRERLNDIRHCSEVIVICPVDGMWSTWSPWNDCSSTCGEASFKTRTRQCDNPPPQNGGLKCQGEKFEKKDCKLGPCPGDGDSSYPGPADSSVGGGSTPPCDDEDYPSSTGEGGSGCRDPTDGSSSDVDNGEISIESLDYSD
ncbi:coadhesin-like [Patiria miniata]|uniref:Hemicentin-1 n=1 Tax=Patiria miniata TaxID=46514 RepID=A0A913ZSX8_PATMI|nr:coadhesin-like [Patiria miniata]